MTVFQPGDTAPPTVPDPVPPPPAPPHTPLYQRVAALEDHITQLTAMHNRFVDDVTAELGI